MRRGVRRLAERRSRSPGVVRGRSTTARSARSATRCLRLRRLRAPSDGGRRDLARSSRTSSNGRALGRVRAAERHRLSIDPPRRLRLELCCGGSRSPCAAGQVERPRGGTSRPRSPGARSGAARAGDAERPGDRCRDRLRVATGRLRRALVERRIRRHSPDASRCFGGFE